MNASGAVSTLRTSIAKFARSVNLSGWSVTVFAVTTVITAPIAAIFYLAVFPAENIWPHLLATVLPGAISQTLLLMVGVGALTLIIGTATAWLVSVYEFPGSRWFGWLLLIPLSVPTYLTAFCYVELFDYSGLFQTWLRELAGWRSARDYWFPEIRSLPGTIFVMSFVLYPYVYLSARASFARQSAGVLEAARTLGRTPFGAFWNVALPLARPALVAGVALALMETLNDIGAVEYLGVQTLTISVYSTWLDRSNLGGAAQIACVMLIFVIALFVIERSSRRGRRYYNQAAVDDYVTTTRLIGVRAGLAALVCLLPILFGFVFPVTILIHSMFIFPEDIANAAYWLSCWHSILLAGMAAGGAVVIGTLIGYVRRMSPTPLVKAGARLSSIGYAVPGTVLAVGILIPLATFDNYVDALSRSAFGVSTGLLLSGSIFAIVLAYLVRFMAVSLGAIEAGMQRVSPNMDAAARTLGRGRLATLTQVLLPNIRPALGAAAVLVFVDSMKELPATLLLRPFNFDTLATHVYTLASLDLFEEGALAALTIVAIGLVPVLLLHHTISATR